MSEKFGTRHIMFGITRDADWRIKKCGLAYNGEALRNGTTISQKAEMSKTQKQVAGEESPKASSTTVTDRIGENVLRVLGRPQHFLRIQVKNLWEGVYRANVFVGDEQNVELPHSFFLQTTNEGEIVTSSPSLTRVY